MAFLTPSLSRKHVSYSKVCCCISINTLLAISSAAMTERHVDHDKWSKKVLMHAMYQLYSVLPLGCYKSMLAGARLLMQMLYGM